MTVEDQPTLFSGNINLPPLQEIHHTEAKLRY